MGHRGFFLLRRLFVPTLWGAAMAAFGAGAVPSPWAFELSGIVCGADLDGDGVVDSSPGELAYCVSGVCPVATHPPRSHAMHP